MARLEDAHGAAHFKLKVPFSSFSSLLVSFTLVQSPAILMALTLNVT
jgi:hypothetical protein